MITSKKVCSSLTSLIIKNGYLKINYFIEDIINIYLTSYNNIFSDLLIEDTSLSKPEYFFDSYKDSLHNFNYITGAGSNYIKLVVPNEDTYEFVGRLRFLELLQIGVIGTYYELPINDYNELLSRKDLSKTLLNVLYDLPGVVSEDITTELDFYLLNITYNVHEIFQKILGKNLTVFPFSNFAPINLFSDGEEYFNKNKNILTAKIIEQSILDLKRGI